MKGQKLNQHGSGDGMSSQLKGKAKMPKTNKEGTKGTRAMSGSGIGGRIVNSGMVKSGPPR